MKNQKMNSLVVTYRQSRDDSAFNEIYRKFIAKPKEVYDEIAQSLKATTADVIAVYEDTLLRCIESYNGETDFERYFNRAVKVERAGIYNRQRRRMKFEWLESDMATPDEFTATSPLELATNSALIEDNSAATEALKKTEADQRQLIDFLTRNSDAKTTVIVKAITDDDSPKFKPTAIGRKIGLHHMQVKRTIEQLASNFDTQTFGDYRDYLLAR